MDLSTAINYALDGKAILFAGSGFAYGALNIMDEKFVFGDGLRDVIASDGSFNSTNTLKSTVQYYLSDKVKKERIDLIKLLRQQFTLKKTAYHHDVLLSFNWKRIYTTNYDSIIETACSKSKIIINTIVLSDKINEHNLSDVCVHFNGHIDRLNTTNLDTEFKLSETSYKCDSLTGNDWYELFTEDLRSAKAIIIIGYSMKDDIDITRLLSVPDIKKKILIIDKPNPDDIEKNSLEECGHCEFIGIEKFANIVVENKRGFKASLIPDQYFSFKICKEEYTSGKIVFDDLVNFYKQGLYNQKILNKSLSNEYKYVVARKALNLAIRAISNKRKVILVSSDLGNGKTIFLETLKNELLNRNYSMYTLVSERKKHITK
jgi:hypothetical protein